MRIIELQTVFAKWYLLPFGWIYRAFDILFTRLGKSIRELKAIAKTKQDKDEKYKDPRVIADLFASEVSLFGSFV